MKFCRTMHKQLLTVKAPYLYVTKLRMSCLNFSKSLVVKYYLVL